MSFDAGLRGLADKAAPDPFSGLSQDFRGLVDYAAPYPVPDLVDVPSTTMNIILSHWKKSTRIPRTWACACRSLIRVCPCDRSLLQGNYSPDVSGACLAFPSPVLRQVTCLTCDMNTRGCSDISQLCEVF